MLICYEGLSVEARSDWYSFGLSDSEASWDSYSCGISMGWRVTGVIETPCVARLGHTITPATSS